MDIQIIQANASHWKRCAEILYQSELGKRYYPNQSMLEQAVSEGISEDQFFVAESPEGVIGFVWFSLNGAFSSFPYLHMIVVEEAYREFGVGKQLISFYEQYSLQSKHCLRTKSFLVVAEFNEKAHKLYHSLGYDDLLVMESLFRKGVRENFMCKNIHKLRLQA